MRILICSSAVVLAIGATLLVPDAGALAAPSTTEVGRMHRIIIPETGTPAPAVKANNIKANRPANRQTQVSTPSPVKAPVQSMINRAVRAGARGAVAPLPLP